MKVHLDPSIEIHIRKHIGDKIIHEVNVNVYCNLDELEIYWDEMK